MAKGKRERGFLWCLRSLKYGIRNHVCISRGNYFLVLPLLILNSKYNQNYKAYHLLSYSYYTIYLC